jgi:hypothetical protein
LVKNIDEGDALPHLTKSDFVIQYNRNIGLPDCTLKTKKQEFA